MKNRNKKIIFTGGGTAGHVLPNIPLIQALHKKEGVEVFYLGDRNGIEKSLTATYVTRFYHLSSGKFRRYWSLRNFSDVFRILLGIIQSFFIILSIRPRFVFSKGGFVSFPVVVAAWLNRVPVIIHESDLTPGLTNRLCCPFASHICVSFSDTKDLFPESKSVSVTGIPLRDTFSSRTPLPDSLPPKINKPRVLIFGGSQGAQPINTIITQSIPELTQHFQIIHITGNNPIAAPFMAAPDYHPLSYVGEDFAALLKSADVVLCRAGASSIHELLYLKVPHILVPLPTYASRGDQIENAKWCSKKGVSHVIDQSDLSDVHLVETIQSTLDHRADYQQKMESVVTPNPVNRILNVLEPYL